MCHLSLFYPTTTINNCCCQLRQLLFWEWGWQDCQSFPTHTLHQRIEPHVGQKIGYYAFSPLSIHPRAQEEIFMLMQGPLSIHYSHAQEFFLVLTHTASWEPCSFIHDFPVKGHSRFRLYDLLTEWYDRVIFRHFGVEIRTVVLPMSIVSAILLELCCVAVVSPCVVIVVVFFTSGVWCKFPSRTDCLESFSPCCELCSLFMFWDCCFPHVH